MSLVLSWLACPLFLLIIATAMPAADWVLDRKSLTVPPLDLIKTIKGKSGVVGIDQRLSLPWITERDSLDLIAILQDEKQRGEVSLSVASSFSSRINPPSNVGNEIRKMAFSLRVGHYPLSQLEEVDALAMSLSDTISLLKTAPGTVVPMPAVSPISPPAPK